MIVPVGLRLENIRFTNFRNYETFSLDCGLENVVFVGKNAVGKTNIIEGIQLVSAIDSFRASRWSDVIRWGSEESSIKASISGDGRLLELNCTFEGGKRSYKLNGKSKRASQLRGTLPAVLFTPDDLQLIKDQAQRRRLAIDNVGVQLSHNYASLKSEYEKTVRQRNHLLKDQFISVDYIDAWTQTMIMIGSRFFQHRFNLFSQLADKTALIYNQLVPGEELEALYIPSWDVVEYNRSGSLPCSYSKMESEGVRGVFSEAIEKVRAEEYARKVSLIGPHRDEVVFLLNGTDARRFASQGQQRTIVLAFKLAEVSIIEGIGGQPPLLLLDDVMSELDENRRNALMDYTTKGIQTFITTTNTGYFSNAMLERSQIVSL